MDKLLRRLPSLRNAALIIKVPTGSSFEDTVRTIHESGVNSDDFGATVTGIRKTRGERCRCRLGQGWLVQSNCHPSEERASREDIRCLRPGGSIWI